MPIGHTGMRRSSNPGPQMPRGKTAFFSNAKLGVKKNSGVVKKSKAVASTASRMASKGAEAAQEVATASKGAAAGAATAAQGAATAAKSAATTAKSAATQAAKSAQKVCSLSAFIRLFIGCFVRGDPHSCRISCTHVSW